jgi:tight adherence protein B
MDILFYGFVVFLFAAVILGIEGSYLWWVSTHGAAAQRVARRLQLMSGSAGRSGERISILKQRRYAGNDLADRLLHRVALAHRIDRLLLQSGKKWSVQHFLLWSGVALLAGAFVAAQLPLPLVIKIGLGLLCALLPLMLVRRARKRPTSSPAPCAPATPSPTSCKSSATSCRNRSAPTSVSRVRKSTMAYQWAKRCTTWRRGFH